tara:strand:- start:924 stop:1997 length:1074 start_codon:yes stop_codon:yes gene_type:complete
MYGNNPKSAHSIGYNKSRLGSVFLLADGTEWLGKVHKSPDGINWLTGKEHTSESKELIYVPTLIPFPETGDPATVDALDIVFKDLAASNDAAELGIRQLKGAVQALSNTVRINKARIIGVVGQIIEASSGSAVQREEHGVGSISDIFSDNAWLLETEGITDHSSSISTVVYAHGNTDHVPYLFNGNIESTQQGEGLSNIRNSSISLDMVSRVPTFTIADILNIINSNLQISTVANDFRSIPASASPGFSGKLQIILAGEPSVSHIQIQYGTPLNIAKIIINDNENLIASQISYNLYYISPTPVTTISIFFEYNAPVPFHSVVDIAEDLTIFDRLSVIFDGAEVPETEDTDTTNEGGY